MKNILIYTQFLIVLAIGLSVPIYMTIFSLSNPDMTQTQVFLVMYKEVLAWIIIFYLALIILYKRLAKELE